MKKPDLKNKIVPKKWTEICPLGTKVGNEESKFFVSLARNKKYDWRSIAAISKESSLSKKRVEEIIVKYHKLGIVLQHPKNELHWGYWERVPHLLPDRKKSISFSDKENRIKKAINKDD